MGTSGLILFQMSIDGPHDDHSTKANTHNNNATQATAYWVRGTQFNTIESACTRSPCASRQKSRDRETHLSLSRRQPSFHGEWENSISRRASFFLMSPTWFGRIFSFDPMTKRPNRRCRDQFALTTNDNKNEEAKRKRKMANVKRNAMRTDGVRRK